MAGFIVGKTGERKTGMAGAGAILIAMIVMHSIGVDTHDWVIVLSLALTGLGMGIAAPSLTALLAASVKSSDMGVASAMQQLMSQMGAVMGGALMISVHDITEKSGKVVSYSNGLLVGVVCAALAIVTASLVRSVDRSANTL
jgi:MFS family permease